jgi:hypothetical protein
MGYALIVNFRSAIVSALKKIFADETFVYDLKFDMPAEEY